MLYKKFTCPESLLEILIWQARGLGQDFFFFFKLQWLLLNCSKPGCWAQLLKALPIRGLLPVPSPWRGGRVKPLSR